MPKELVDDTVRDNQIKEMYLTTDKPLYEMEKHFHLTAARIKTILKGMGVELISIQQRQHKVFQKERNEPAARAKWEAEMEKMRREHKERLEQQSKEREEEKVRQEKSMVLIKGKVTVGGYIYETDLDLKVGDKVLLPVPYGMWDIPGFDKPREGTVTSLKVSTDYDGPCRKIIKKL